MGRELTERDRGSSELVAVINETMARTYFPNVSPLGRTFAVQDDDINLTEWQNLEVVGVVKDAKYNHLDEKRAPAAFYPHAQHSARILDNFSYATQGIWLPSRVKSEAPSGRLTLICHWTPLPHCRGQLTIPW